MMNRKVISNVYYFKKLTLNLAALYICSNETDDACKGLSLPASSLWHFQGIHLSLESKISF